MFKLEKDGAVLISGVMCANGPWARMRGLLGRRPLLTGEAIHLVPCSSIHTFFMGFSIDVIFLSRNLRVRRIVRGVPRNRTVWGLGSWSALEMASGWFPPDALLVGDAVSLVELTES